MNGFNGYRNLKIHGIKRFTVKFKEPTSSHDESCDHANQRREISRVNDHHLICLYVYQRPPLLVAVGLASASDAGIFFWRSLECTPQTSCRSRRLLEDPAAN
jgi:hypothetical protein